MFKNLLEHGLCTCVSMCSCLVRLYELVAHMGIGNSAFQLCSIYYCDLPKTVFWLMKQHDFCSSDIEPPIGHGDNVPTMQF